MEKKKKRKREYFEPQVLSFLVFQLMKISCLFDQNLKNKRGD